VTSYHAGDGYSAGSFPAGLVSGEGVAIELSRAGLGTRLVAVFIDFAVQLAMLAVLVLMDGFLAGDADMLVAILIVELLLVFAGYPIVSEWLSRGRTIGKLAMGLRVVRDDGGPIGFRQALARGLVGLILEKPGLFIPISTACGVITLGVSRSSKRIGDYVAGTFVLNERVGARASSSLSIVLQVPPGLQGWASTLDLSRLDDSLALTVRQFVLRANEMSQLARGTLESQLANTVLGVIAPPPPYPIPASALLISVLAERRRRSEVGAAVPAPYSWSPEQPSTWQLPR
jgi:uncharacterized RDD family membrane protein YckC